MCGFNVLLNRTRTPGIVNPVKSSGVGTGRTDLTKSNLRSLTDNALQRVIDLLNARSSLTDRQQQLRDAAQKLLDTRRATGETLTEIQVTEDRKLLPQYPNTNAVIDTWFEMHRAQSVGIGALLDSADDTTATVPDKLIEKLLELARLDKRLIEVGGKVIDARSTNKYADGNPFTDNPEKGLTIQEAIQKERAKGGYPLLGK